MSICLRRGRTDSLQTAHVNLSLYKATSNKYRLMKCSPVYLYLYRADIIKGMASLADGCSRHQLGPVRLTPPTSQNVCHKNCYVQISKGHVTGEFADIHCSYIWLSLLIYPFSSLLVIRKAENNNHSHQKERIFSLFQSHHFPQPTSYRLCTFRTQHVKA